MENGGVLEFNSDAYELDARLNRKRHTDISAVGGDDNNEIFINSEMKVMRRRAANDNERRRMQNINAGFQEVKSLLPSQNLDVGKLSKATVLRLAADYTRALLKDNMHLRHTLSDIGCPQSPLEFNFSSPPPNEVTAASSPPTPVPPSPYESNVIQSMRQEIDNLKGQLELERKIRSNLSKHFTHIPAPLDASSFRGERVMPTLTYQSQSPCGSDSANGGYVSPIGITACPLQTATNLVKPEPRKAARKSRSFTSMEFRSAPVTPVDQLLISPNSWSTPSPIRPIKFNSPPPVMGTMQQMRVPTPSEQTFVVVSKLPQNLPQNAVLLQHANPVPVSSPIAPPHPPRSNHISPPMNQWHNQRPNFGAFQNIQATQPTKMTHQGHVMDPMTHQGHVLVKVSDHNEQLDFDSVLGTNQSHQTVTMHLNGHSGQGSSLVRLLNGND